MMSPSSRTTSPALPQRPQKKRQRPLRTKKTSAVRWECSELRHPRRLAGGADVEARGLLDVDVLVRALGDAAADDGEVLLLVRARGVGVDEGGLAGAEVAVADDPLLHVGGGQPGQFERSHQRSPVCSRICFQIAVSSKRVHSRRIAGRPPSPKGPNSAWLMPMTWTSAPVGVPNRPQPACLPVQRPAQRGARRHQRVVAADHVVEPEGRVGEGRAQPEPEAVGGLAAEAVLAAGMEQVHRPVVGGRDHREIRGHDAGEDVGEARAPLVVVAAAVVGAGDVGGRGERPGAALGAALAGDQVAGPAVRGRSPSAARSPPGRGSATRRRPGRRGSRSRRWMR